MFLHLYKAFLSFKLQYHSSFLLILSLYSLIMPITFLSKVLVLSVWESEDNFSHKNIVASMVNILLEIF